MDERIGQQLGNYRLISFLGQGAFAKVYLAEHVLLRNKVAIKLLHTHLDTDSSEQFVSEARIIASLTHANIVRVFDFNVENGVPYIVEDYAPNGTIRQKHPKGTRIPLAAVIKYTEQVANALQYAHDHRVIHRDIKPENMLLGPHEQILLGDFGIATVAKSTRLQSLRDIAGTVSYMAPEQLQGQPRRASDQYSLGIVIYEWLTGVCPFLGSFTEVASQHLFTPPVPLELKVQGLPAGIEEVLFIALAKEPEHRFSSVRAFFNALKQASREGNASSFYPSSSGYNAPPPPSFNWYSQSVDQKEREIPLQHSSPLPSIPLQNSPSLPETPIPPIYMGNVLDEGNKYSLPQTQGVASVETSPPLASRPLQSRKRKKVPLWGVVLSILIVVGLIGGLFATGILPFFHNTNCTGFSDRFQQDDLGGWTWIDPSSASSYDLKNPSHYLHMYSPGTVDEDMNPNNNTQAPRLIQPVNGDFSIETQVDFIQQPGTFQGAAILIWQSDSKFIRLEISAWNNKYYGVNFVYYDMSDPNNNFHDLSSKLLATPPTVKLRLERRGNVFSGAWQQGTGEWNPINKTYTMTAEPVQAGLILMNSAIAPSPLRPADANFHYFHFACL